jgi:Domain of unknown function (DUF4156)
MPAIMAGIVVFRSRTMSPRLFALAISSVFAAGCTWVHMAPGASKVRVVDGTPVDCEKRGEVEVSVRDSIAFYERNHLKVRDELETLARNEAPGLGADTVQPLAPPEAGEQRYIAWRCAR